MSIETSIQASGKLQQSLPTPKIDPEVVNKIAETLKKLTDDSQSR